jgi:hypothetical protein
LEGHHEALLRIINTEFVNFENKEKLLGFSVKKRKICIQSEWDYTEMKG